jgi:hypothetical protein
LFMRPHYRGTGDHDAGVNRIIGDRTGDVTARHSNKLALGTRSVDFTLIVWRQHAREF